MLLRPGSLSSEGHWQSIVVNQALKYRRPMGREIGLSILGSKFHILYLQLSGVCQSRNTSLEGKKCPREQDLKESGSTNISFQNSVLLCDLGAFPVAIERSEAILIPKPFCVLEHFLSFFLFCSKACRKFLFSIF